MFLLKSSNDPHLPNNHIHFLEENHTFPTMSSPNLFSLLDALRIAPTCRLSLPCFSLPKHVSCLLSGGGIAVRSPAFFARFLSDPSPHPSSSSSIRGSERIPDKDTFGLTVALR